MKKIEKSNIVGTEAPTLKELLDFDDLTNDLYVKMYKEIKEKKQNEKFDEAMAQVILFFSAIIAIMEIGFTYVNKRFFRVVIANPFQTYNNISNIASNIRLLIQLSAPIYKNWGTLKTNIADVLEVFFKFVLNVVKKVGEKFK